MKQTPKKQPNATTHVSPETHPYDLGARIRFIRESRKLSQMALSQAAKVSQSTIAQIETGKIDPSVKTLTKIAMALDSNIATFFASQDVHVFDMQRMNKKYDEVDKLTPHLYMALGKVVQYARDIGFLKG